MSLSEVNHSSSFIAAPASKRAKVETPSGSVDFSKMKVTELKKELESRGLDTSGKKAELVARLEAGGGATGEDSRELVCMTSGLV